MTTDIAETVEPGLALVIRTETMEAHMAAESEPFVEDLVEGRLPIIDYALMTAQQHAIYSALEAVMAANTDPTIALFKTPGLERTASLEADLEFLAGSGWASKLPLTPSTIEYAAHIRRLETDWPNGILAHHYIRYMGDLSGGQLIRRVVKRVYHFEDENGTLFYNFPEIPSAKAFKEHYRDLLDQLPWDGAEKARLVDEVSLAYRFHAAIFRELAALN